MSAPTINWTGRSGAQYQYWIYPIGTAFANKPGNYVFAKETSPGRWLPIYIGQSEDLGRRLANHDREPDARRLGATHIHAHTHTGSETRRLTEERDLIEKWRPACNTQYT